LVSVSDSAASFEAIQAEIDAGRLVGARIGWGGGDGGHFMVIYGYGVLGVVQYLDIDDPIYGKVHLSIDDFTNNYQGNGSWTHTYMTKSYLPNIPFKPYDIKDFIPEIIWAARPILDQPVARQHKDAKPDEAWRNASLTLAHPVYTIGLDELAEERSDFAATSPVAVRVLESVDNQLRAVFDVSGNVEPRVAQMTASEAYLDKLTRGLEQSLAFLKEQEVGVEEVELRLLRVPALNFEALWLHLDSENADWLVPIISLGTLEPFMPVPMDEAQEILSSEAKVIAGMDDDMGA
jgi:hypothetical protein